MLPRLDPPTPGRDPSQQVTELKGLFPQIPAEANTLLTDCVLRLW